MSSLPKERDVGAAVTEAFTPAPDRGTLMLPALLLMIKDPDRLPRAVGVKVTLITQLAPGVITAVQLFV